MEHRITEYLETLSCSGCKYFRYGNCRSYNNADNIKAKNEVLAVFNTNAARGGNNTEYFKKMAENIDKVFVCGYFKPKVIVDLKCQWCGDEWRGEELDRCCNGDQCGCMGLPIEPEVCSGECYDKLVASYAPKIILTLGTSGSGKSTWVLSLPANKYTVISPDDMRRELTGDVNDKSKDHEIYESVKTLSIKAVSNGRSVIIDSTNLQRDRRRDFINSIKTAAPYAIIHYKLMPLDTELAKQRIRTAMESGIDRANVTDATIDRHGMLYAAMLEDIKEECITEFQN